MKLNRWSVRNKNLIPEAQKSHLLKQHQEAWLELGWILKGPLFIPRGKGLKKLSTQAPSKTANKSSVINFRAMSHILNCDFK